MSSDFRSVHLCSFIVRSNLVLASIINPLEGGALKEGRENQPLNLFASAPSLLRHHHKACSELCDAR
jgi:hypothetical protein